MKICKKIINIIIALILLLLFWQIAFILEGKNNAIIPSIVQVVKSIKELFISGVLLEDICISLYRFFIGYVLSAIVAIILGIILGWNKWAWNIVNPIVQVLRPVSPVAWFPFIVVAFGIGNLPAIIIIFIAGFFPILISTVTAVQNIDAIYLKIANNFEIKGIRFVMEIMLPVIFPAIANALHISLGTAWIFLVSGEMIGAQSGLGYLIIDSRNNLRKDMLLSAIIFIGIIGFVLDKLITYFQEKIELKWGK